LFLDDKYTHGNTVTVSTRCRLRLLQTTLSLHTFSLLNEQMSSFLTAQLHAI